MLRASSVAPRTHAPFENMSPRPLSFAIDSVKNFDCPIGRTRRESFSVVIQLSVMLCSTAWSGHTQRRNERNTQSYHRGLFRWGLDRRLSWMPRRFNASRMGRFELRNVGERTISRIGQVKCLMAVTPRRVEWQRGWFVFVWLARVPAHPSPRGRTGFSRGP